jgi:polyhydroxyalkanoate synthesis repressor PhaR
MATIKRYPNRKLYHLEAKQYVTLQQLAALIQAGQEVVVTDHETGEDLTNLTLTQIILEQEKRSNAGVVPRALLTGLIRTGGETLDQVRRVLPAWPGRADGPRVEATREAAIEQGRQVAEAIQTLLRLDARVDDLLHLFNLPTRRDLETLQTRVEQLNLRLEQLLAEEQAQRHPAQDPDPDGAV